MILPKRHLLRSDDHSGDVSSISVVAERGRNLMNGTYNHAKKSFTPVIQITVSQTLSSKPETLNPDPSTLNPKP